jgi:hypothetical protein
MGFSSGPAGCSLADMEPSLADLLQLPLPTPALVLKAWPGGERYVFDDAEYDADEDRLRLTAGPPTVAAAELTPEGHVVRVAMPDGRLCGLVLVDVHDRLERFGHLEVTLGPRQFVTLAIDDLAGLLTCAAARRSHRFARAA